MTNRLKQKCERCQNGLNILVKQKPPFTPEAFQTFKPYSHYYFVAVILPLFRGSGFQYISHILRYMYQCTEIQFFFHIFSLTIT